LILKCFLKSRNDHSIPVPKTVPNSDAHRRPCQNHEGVLFDVAEAVKMLLGCTGWSCTRPTIPLFTPLVHFMSY